MRGERQQDFHDITGDARVQIRFGLVPEEHGALEQGSVLDEEPNESQLAESLSEQGELELTPLVLEEELLLLHRYGSRDVLFKLLEQGAPCAVGRTLPLGFERPVDEVDVGLIEPQFVFFVERAKARGLCEHLLDRNVDTLQRLFLPILYSCLHLIRRGYVAREV